MRGEVQSSVVVYCRLDESTAELRPGTLGHARILCGRRSVKDLIAERVLGFLRTEFW